MGRIKEEWAAGAFTDLSQYGTAILNAKAIGKYEALANIEGIELQDIISEISEDEK